MHLLKLSCLTLISEWCLARVYLVPRNSDSSLLSSEIEDHSSLLYLESPKLTLLGTSGTFPCLEPLGLYCQTLFLNFTCLVTLGLPCQTPLLDFTYMVTLGLPCQTPILNFTCQTSTPVHLTYLIR